MNTAIVQETHGVGHLRFGSTPAYAPPARRPAREGTTTPKHVLDPQTLGAHMDRLFRAAWALCGSREDAEDLVQDTYARVLARPRAVRNSDDLGHLLRVLRNSFISGRRAAARRPLAAGTDAEALELQDPRAGAAEPPVAAEAREVLAAIAALPPTFRHTLVAIDVAGLSYLEAARALHVREATVTTRLFRARSQVAKSLSPAAAVPGGGRRA